MKKLLTYLLPLIATAASAQTAGDYASFRKSVGPGDIKTYYTPVNSSLYSVNGSGNFALLAQSTFLTPTQGNAAYSLLGHTHLSAHITDASEGGAGTSDASKLLKFTSTGGVQAYSLGGAALRGETSSGDGVYGLSNTGVGLYGRSTGAGGVPLYLTHVGGSGNFLQCWKPGDPSFSFSVSQTGALDWDNNGAKTTTRTNLGLGSLATQSSVAWGSITGTLSAQNDLQNVIDAINMSLSNLITVANALFPIASTGSANDLSSGTVPTARLGSGTANSTTFLRGDNTWQTVGGGSGTVTSVSVTTANGVSGSVATATTTPAISLTLGAITPTSVAASGAVSGSNLSGTNTGDQTSIVGITGSLSDFNTALTGADFATGGGTATGTNTGDQTNISGNAATVTTNANLTGPITSVGNTTTVAETELSAIAGLTSAADKTIQFTGSGTAALVDLKLGTEVAYSGTITWTAGTAPSSTANLRQFYTRVGNMVTWEISLTYAVAGSTVTGISLTFPTEFPTPAIPTGFTGANVKLWQCFPTRLLTSPTSATSNGTTHMIQRNAADTGFEISGSVFASGSYRTFHLGGIYFTN